MHKGRKSSRYGCGWFCFQQQNKCLPKGREKDSMKSKNSPFFVRHLLYAKFDVWHCYWTDNDHSMLFIIVWLFTVIFFFEIDWRFGKHTFFDSEWKIESCLVLVLVFCLLQSHNSNARSLVPLLKDSFFQVFTLVFLVGFLKLSLFIHLTRMYLLLELMRVVTCERIEKKRFTQNRGKGFDLYVE